MSGIQDGSQRVPILLNNRASVLLGLREPVILGLRHPIHLNEPLEWDDVYNKFNNYIKFASKNVFESNTNMFVVSAEDLYQEGLLLLWKCFEQYQFKSLAEFGYIFKASVWRHLRGIASKTETPSDNIDEVFDIGVEDDTWEEMWEEHRMRQVVDLLKDFPIAIEVLHEFVRPSISTFKECEADMARKETVRSQGYKVNVPATLEVRGCHIQRALNLSKELYMANFKIIQKVVYSVYSPDATIRNYMPSSDELLLVGNNAMVESSSTLPVMTSEPVLDDSDLHELVCRLSELMRPNTELHKPNVQENDINVG